MPRRVVIACWGSHGDLFPYIGLAKALRALGHSAVVATVEQYRANVEAEGLEFARVGPDIDPQDRDLIARVMDPVRGAEVIVREMLLPKLRESFEELLRAASGADALVGHPLTFTVPMVAEITETPWVATTLAPMQFFSPSDLPVFPALPALRHLGDLRAWLSSPLIGLARRATAVWLKPVQALRVELGLGPGTHPLFEGLFSPHLTLALFSRVLGAPQPDWRTNVVQTGFVFYNESAAMAPELEAFLADGPPPVVFTLGTSAVGAAGRFYHESADAAARLGVRAVLLTGGYPQNTPDNVPPGVLLVDRAPHEQLFPRASAVVHQGGVGTTGQALRSGRPMIVVPHGHDQPDNAFRVTKLGVARTLYPRRYRADRLAAELARLLREPLYRDSATTTAGVVRAEGGADAAARAIERLMGSAER